MFLTNIGINITSIITIAKIWNLYRNFKFSYGVKPTFHKWIERWLLLFTDKQELRNALVNYKIPKIHIWFSTGKKDLFWRFQIATVAAILKSSDCSELGNYMPILVFLYFKNNFKIQNTEANYISNYLLGNIVLYSK